VRSDFFLDEAFVKLVHFHFPEPFFLFLFLVAAAGTREGTAFPRSEKTSLLTFFGFLFLFFVCFTSEVVPFEASSFARISRTSDIRV